MLKTENKKSLFKRFLKDESGNMALTFAISAVAVIGAMGAAMDFSTRSSAKLHSQGIADQIALAAAIYVKDNDFIPDDLTEGYTEGTHSAASLGFEFKGWVDGGADNVAVDIRYDDTEKEAVVTVSGATIPTFMQVLGQHDLSFAATSTVSYLEVDEAQPASIIMVMDNSGSMRWDDRLLNDDGTRPANSGPRIDRLKSAVTNFRTRLQSRIGNQTTAEGVRVLRTGLVPYNDQIITSLSANTDKVYWGFEGINQGQVSSMQARGGTNSNPPMQLAKQLLNMENDEHEDEADRTNTDYREPLKFVVFMTDGQNTTGNFAVIPGETGQYYGFNTGQIPNRRTGVWYVTDREDIANAYNFTEGYFGRQSDLDTIAECQAMHAEGVEIFTIGFALEPGDYYDETNPSQPRTVSFTTQAISHSVLSGCASEPDNFIIAGQQNDLQSAFNTIQNAIVKELIRIKS